jgi:hypothetical protein
MEGILMRLGTFSLLCLVKVVLVGQGAATAFAVGPMPMGQSDRDTPSRTHATAIAYLHLGEDQGPQGLFIDVQGHDNNDDIVAKISYNNQDANTVHIDSIYVHGENLATQGRIPVDLDIPSGSKQELALIRRDKKGVPSKVFVDIHFR